MPTVIVEKLIKTFGKSLAVDQVSFEVFSGEIFGLIGPNGAGKTTTIRTILDIYKPDSGHIQVFNQTINEASKKKIGYLPEERGLYQELPLEKCLLYLISLKGLNGETARKRINELLEKFDLAQYKRKKIKELSKGMQQKAQIILTIAHQPDLIIIDEPFSGLDPVNTQMVRSLLLQEKERGASIIMSSHQMHQVEELSDRLAVIDHGKTILYGQTNEIRRQYAGHNLVVNTPSKIENNIPGVTIHPTDPDQYLLELPGDKTPQDVLKILIDQNIVIEKFEIEIPSLEQIFIQVVSPTNGNHE
jgi:ABC-2 type transport system ATP-binding protein